MKIAKKTYYLFLALSLYSPSLYSADDTIFSRTFIDKLAECTPYEENKNYHFQDIEYQNTYKIIGWQDENCLMEIYSQSLNSPKTIQTCSFDSDDLKKYVTIAHTILDKKKPQNFSEAIERSTELDTISLAILQNINCNRKREEWDPTKNIRKALPTCQILENKQKAQNRIEYVRRILGKKNTECHYILEVWKRAPNFNNYTGNDKKEWKEILKDMKDIQTVYDCFFNQEQIKQLITTQKKMILLAYDSKNNTEGVDEENLDNFDPLAELNFVSENCNITQNFVAPIQNNK